MTNGKGWLTIRDGVLTSEDIVLSENRAKVTERTFYPALIEQIEAQGGEGVSEVSYTSVPDVVFTLLGRNWLLSLKIGEDIATLKSAFIQYQRQKEESRLRHGLILFLPGSVRTIKANREDVSRAVLTSPGTCLVDTPVVKEEYRDLTFPQVLMRLKTDIGVRLEGRVEKGYSLKLVIALLKQHLSELMSTVSLSDPMLLRVVTDRKLLTGISHLKADQTEAVGRFLSSYIVLSQILFLRLYSSATQETSEVVEGLRPVNHHSLRRAFGRVLERDYRNIYKVDVLDSISERYLLDTFDLIWGLEVERVRHELPGRIFHELMPRNIRKMLAAFYTRPQAADILAGLAVRSSGDTVFDPASGSGTILTAAYKRKRVLFREEGKAGNPHRRFCENDIFGADIMPFAVHLTTANLAAMDPATTLVRTQVIQGDSLRLSSGRKYRDGMQIEMFPLLPEAEKNSGDRYVVDLRRVDVILMNPPFTKVERGIQKYVDMRRFHASVGGEIGLWGHFVALADRFLAEGGVFGAVIPINVLRGRESARVRSFILSRWTPQYILKATYNYGFSEWSEYRDVLLVAARKPSRPDEVVKFCLIKRDLGDLTDDDADHIARQVSSLRRLRSDELDIGSFAIGDVLQRSANLMWFCGVSDLRHRDVFVDLVGRFEGVVGKLPTDRVREGYRTEGGNAKVLIMTRRTSDARVEEAFLHFERAGDREIECRTTLGTTVRIERGCVKPCLRTAVGVVCLDVTERCDYMAYAPYRELSRVKRASGIRGRFERDFWEAHQRRVDRLGAHLLVVRRINPYSPSSHLMAFFSSRPICPTDQLKALPGFGLDESRAMAALFNSILFLVQFALLKEESTGRFIDIRSGDLAEMSIYPEESAVPELVKVFDRFSHTEFPSLGEQLDTRFAQRYKDFWSTQRDHKPPLLSVVADPVEPSDTRVRFDLEVSRALGVEVTRDELVAVYGAIVKEMILTRGLTRD